MVAEFRSRNDQRATDLQINAQMLLEEEILEAGLEQHLDPSKGKFQIAQIAKWTGVPVEAVEHIAHALVSRRVGVDLEESEFNSMIEQVRKIESVLDDGFREFKLEKLARRYKLPKTAMMNCFYKALINQAPFVAYGVEDLDQLCQVEREWLVNGWIPKGIVLLLHAMGGVGKSLMIYELIECIAKGQPWNGYQISKGRVLILQSDEPVVVTRERMQIRQLTNHHPVEVVPGWQVENIARLEAYLKKYQESGDPVSFCMIDSVTSINRNTLISENDTEYARFMLQLNDLGDRYGCTFCVIHHSNSEGESRGTKALYNSASEVWGLLLTDERSGDRILRVQKTRMGRPPGRYAFKFDEDTFTFEYLGREGSESEEESIHTEKRIELWLNEDERQGVRFEVEEIAHHLSLNKNTIRRVLKEMWAKGMVQRCLKGQGNTMLYFSTLCRSTDQPRSTRDRHVDRHENNGISTKTAPVDRSIDKKPIFNTVENSKNADRPIDTGTLPSPSIENRVDRRVDRVSIEGSIASIDAALIENADQPIDVGDIVVPTGVGSWISYGSDKLPTEKVPSLLKEAKAIPLTDLPMDLRRELLQPSRVLRVKGDRVRVRSQESGRNSVFLLKDLDLLSKSNGKTKD